MPNSTRNLLYISAALIIALWAWQVADIIPILISTIVLGWALLALAIKDWRHQRLPDKLTLPLVIVGLAVTAYGRPDAMAWHLAGAATGYAAFRLIGYLYHRFRGRDGLGQGDAKLMAAAGAWVGLPGLPSVILIGSLAGLIYAGVLSIRDRHSLADQRLPFGSFLSLGIWITWLYGPIQLFG